MVRRRRVGAECCSRAATKDGARAWIAGRVASDDDARVSSPTLSNVINHCSATTATGTYDVKCVDTGAGDEETRDVILYTVLVRARIGTPPRAVSSRMARCRRLDLPATRDDSRRATRRAKRATASRRCVMSSRASRARSDVVPRRRASWDTVGAPVSRSFFNHRRNYRRRWFAGVRGYIDARAARDDDLATCCVALTTPAPPRCDIAKDYFTLAAHPRRRAAGLAARREPAPTRARRRVRLRRVSRSPSRRMARARSISRPAALVVGEEDEQTPRPNADASGDERVLA